MSVEGTVYDLGYAPHEGARLGRSGAIRAIFVDGLRRSLGLRRKARSKVLPWALIAAAVVPAVALVTVTFYLSGFELETGSPFASHARYFDTIGSLSMLFVALITPTLLIPDRRHGVLAIYASRPVRAVDYLLARSAALALLASAFILVPQTMLYVGIAALNAEGLWTGLRVNAPEILPTLGTTVGYVVGYCAPAFLVSIYSRRVAMASGIFVVAMYLSAGLSEVIPGSTDLWAYRAVAPLAWLFHPLTVRDWLFGLDEARMPFVQVGLPLWSAALVLLAFAVLTGVLAHRRYRRDL